MIDPQTLDRALIARGWHYDAKSELFMDGSRQLDPSEVLGLMPDLTRDDLVAYQNAKFEKLTPGERRNSQASM